jgi:hypothetical protein
MEIVTILSIALILLDRQQIDISTRAGSALCDVAFSRSGFEMRG